MTQDKKLPQRATDDNPIGLDGELDIPLNTPTPMPSSTKYRDKKQDKFRRTSSELQFTSSLYIDQAIESLRENALKANKRTDLLIIESDVTRVDADRARFEFTSEHMGKTTFTITGTMQRWQGSRTRVDAKMGEKRPFWYPIINIVLLLYSFALLLIVPFIILTNNIRLATGGGVGLVLLGILLGMIKLLSEVKNKRGAPQDYYSDELEAILLETFRNHDIQWLSQRRIKDYWR